MSNMIFAQNWSGIDSLTLEERKDPVYGPVTVFYDVVIAREIVQPYDVDGKIMNAYKSADELEQYWPWVNGRWAVAGRHPSTPVVVSPSDIAGRTVNSRFVKNLKDSKTGRPNIRGILVDLEVFNNRVPPEILASMKDGSLTDVSIGYLYAKDMTPGTWNGDAYDFRQVNMFHDHLAFGIKRGRCSFPACGIGADELVKLVNSRGFNIEDATNISNMSTGNDPEETEQYIRIPNREVSECEVTATITISEDQGIKAVYCGQTKEIVSYLFEKSKGWTMSKSQSWVKSHKDSDGDTILSKLIAIESEEEQQEDQEPTPAERAQTKFNITPEDWEKLSDEEKQSYIDKLSEEDSDLAWKDKYPEAYEALPDDKKQLLEPQKKEEEKETKPEDLHLQVERSKRLLNDHRLTREPLKVKA